MSEEEITEKYHHFKIKTADGIELDLIETNQIQVLKKIQPKVINTHESWKTLEVIEDE